MHTAIIYTLIILGAQPYPLGSFSGPTAHGDCNQAKYNFSTGTRGPKPQLVCRPMTVRTR